LKYALSKGLTSLYLEAKECADMVIGEKQTRFSFKAMRAFDLVGFDSADYLRVNLDFEMRSFERALKIRVDNGLPFLCATRHCVEDMPKMLGDEVFKILDEQTIFVPCRVDPAERLARKHEIKNKLKC
jgi:hypothetical protein